ncbi:TPA: hypothetical protein DCG61_01280 [Patescibacteria group bacterium]|jgi:hypothetical protein|nr:hypothetical protein [Patescibacteria group bacterium]
MALSDINFQEGDKQEFLLEIEAGPLLAAEDFLTRDFNGAMIGEIAGQGGGGNNIFIMSE